jgi:hypothetical protein
MAASEDGSELDGAHDASNWLARIESEMRKERLEVTVCVAILVPACDWRCLTSSR